MGNDEIKEGCRMFGKRLSAKDMFRKVDSKKGHYIFVARYVTNNLPANL